MMALAVVFICAGIYVLHAEGTIPCTNILCMNVKKRELLLLLCDPSLLIIDHYYVCISSFMTIFYIKLEK